MRAPNNLKRVSRTNWKIWNARVREILEKKRAAQLGGYELDVYLHWSWGELNDWVVSLPSEPGPRAYAIAFFDKTPNTKIPAVTR